VLIAIFNFLHFCLFPFSTLSKVIIFLSQKIKQLENKKLHYPQFDDAADRKKRSATMMPPHTAFEQIFKL